MKKVLSVLLVILLTLSVLAGCAISGGSNPAETAVSGTGAVDDCKTMSDVFALENRQNEQTALYGDYFIYAFELDGTYYQAIAEISEDIEEELWALDWADPDHDAKQAELIGPKELIRLVNLSDEIIPQEELDALVGKTGQDLLDDGWYNSGWNLDNMEFWMNKGAFSYTVIMEGEVGNYEDFDDEDIGALVIKSVSCTGIGDATNVELDEDGVLID